MDNLDIHSGRASNKYLPQSMFFTPKTKVNSQPSHLLEIQDHEAHNERRCFTMSTPRLT
jgi:hypothetical protein